MKLVVYIFIIVFFGFVLIPALIPILDTQDNINDAVTLLLDEGYTVVADNGNCIETDLICTSIGSGTPVVQGVNNLTTVFVATTDSSQEAINTAQYYFNGGTGSANELQTALDNYDSVTMCNGTWDFDESILLNSNNSLLGEGPNTIITSTSISVDEVSLIGIKNCDTATAYNAAQNINIGNFKIDTPNTNGIGLAHAQYINIDKIWGSDAYWHYLDIAGCSDVFITNIISGTASGYAPIQFDNLTGANGLVILVNGGTINANLDNTISKDIVLDKFDIVASTGSGKYGIHYHRDGGQGVKVTNGIITGGYESIYLDTNTTWSDLTISDVTIYNPGYRHIRFTGDSGVANKNLKISNITCLGPAYQPIVIDNWNNWSISNSYIESDFSIGSASNRYAISAYNGDGATIENCHVVNTGTDNQYKGFGIRNGVTNALISNCTAKDFEHGIFADEGIQCTWDYENFSAISCANKKNASVVSKKLFRKQGVGSIIASGTSAVLNHYIVNTPDEILIQPTSNPGTKVIWVDNITSTQFKVNVSTPTLNQINFDWRAYKD